MEFGEYYKKIEITPEDQVKFDNLLEIAKSICPEDIEQIFISTYPGEDNQTIPGDLWFFSESYIVNFPAEAVKSGSPEMFLIPLNIRWLKIYYSNYDFKKASKDSTLDVVVEFKGHPFRENLSRSTLRTFSFNCDNLKEIIKDYLKPNFIN